MEVSNTDGCIEINLIYPVIRDSVNRIPLNIPLSVSLNIFVLLAWLSHSKRQMATHDDVIKWKHFPRYWPFVRGIHRSPVNSSHKVQWRWALMFSLICARINGWVNNREAGDLRHHQAHCDVIVMHCWNVIRSSQQSFDGADNEARRLTLPPFDHRYRFLGYLGSFSK